mgnify:CR=1 FL=1
MNFFFMLQKSTLGVVPVKGNRNNSPRLTPLESNGKLCAKIRREESI